MDNTTPTVLKINPDFKNLIRPLSKIEYLQLEENLLAEGCREAILTWKKYIVDGHNRYEICTKHDIPFETQEMKFSCKAEVIAWICKNQLGRRNISEETRKYLIGMQYECEKVVSKIKNPKGNNQYSDPDDYIPNEPIITASRVKTANRIANENNVTHMTVRKYAKYAQAIEELRQKSPDLTAKILSGKYKISHNNLLELAEKPIEDLRHIEQTTKKNLTPFVQYSSSRKTLQELKEAPQQAPPKPSVKDMPIFDPDATLVELSLTIPSWIGSLERLKNSIHSDTTKEAKQKLSCAIELLKMKLNEILSVLKEQ